MIWISDLRDASQRYSKIHSAGEVFTKNAIKNTFLLFDVSYSLKDSFLLEDVGRMPKTVLFRSI